MKFSKDGTAQLAYEFQGTTEDLTIAFQAISAENGALQIGPWQYKNAELTMLTAAAPKTVEDADTFPKLAYLEGHPKEKEIDLTIHRYVQMALAKTETYDPMDEFTVSVNGKQVDLVAPSRYWQYALPHENYLKWMVFSSPSTPRYGYDPQVIALKQGFYDLEIYDAFGLQVLDLICVPIVAMNPVVPVDNNENPINPGPPFVPMTGLVNRSKLPKLLEFMSEEEKIYLYPGLIMSIQANAFIDSALHDIKLQEFALGYNQKILDKNVIEFEMSQLPNEVSTMAFFVFFH